jgi:hypothetical protein
MRAAGFSFFYRILSKIFQKIYRIQMGIQAFLKTALFVKN